jgi:hypothetical protein
MATLAVLQRSDENLAFVSATDDATALAAKLSDMQPFGIEVFASFPGKASLLPTVQSILQARHLSNGWYETSAALLAEAVCQVSQVAQNGPETSDAGSDGPSPPDSEEDFAPSTSVPVQQASPPASDDEVPPHPPVQKAKSSRGQAKLPRESSRSPRRQTAAAGKKPATAQEPAKPEQLANHSQQIDPAWHNLLIPCPRGEADLAATIRRALKALLGRWQADWVLSSYTERILRSAGSQCGRYFVNAQGETVRLTAPPATVC